MRTLLLTLLLALAGCASFPTERTGVLPPALQPQAGSAERHVLNGKVYDAAVRHTAATFYRRDAVSSDFRAEAAARRDIAIAADDEATLYAALGGLLRTMDDGHTYALSPAARARLEARRHGRSSATYGLLFVEVRDHVGETAPDAAVHDSPKHGDRRTLVLHVRGDGPAAAAGVQVGWQLLAIDGVRMRDAPPPIAGQPRRLLFVDDAGKRHALSITPREMPPLPRRQSRRLDDGIAWLRFDDFDRASRDWLRERLGEFAADPPRGVILDLRHNGGGNLGIATSVLGMVTADRPLLGRMQGRWLRWNPRARRSAHAWLGPLVLLVGPGSGSASELLAASLQESGRAPLVGETSAGAVIASVGFNLPDGGLLRVGAMHMTSPEGRVLDKTGVSPDHHVPRDWAALRAGRDPVLNAHARYCCRREPEPCGRCRQSPCLERAPPPRRSHPGPPGPISTATADCRSDRRGVRALRPALNLRRDRPSTSVPALWLRHALGPAPPGVVPGVRQHPRLPRAACRNWQSARHPDHRHRSPHAPHSRARAGGDSRGSGTARPARRCRRSCRRSLPRRWA